MTLVLLGATLWLAFVNGANDNFKGVATLYGSGVTGYRGALALATLSTLLGSLASVALAAGLARAFSARGLLPDELLTPAFMAAVALAAALTVMLATWIGMPISTTHALVGGLAGAGLVTAGPALDAGLLTASFALPLLIGPLLAVPLAFAGYRAGRAGRRGLRIEAESCVCVGERWVPTAALQRDGAAGPAATGPVLSVSVGQECERRYSGSLVGVSAQTLATVMHTASAAFVGFARGLNDTPKLLGLLLGASVLSPWAGTAALAAAMAIGGLVGARRVAETLSRKVTVMNQGQGLAGNLATSLLVAAASRVDLPVSTTHVSTGSIFGVGAAGGVLRWRPVAAILGAWMTTLPLAAALGAAAMWALK